VGEGAVVIEGEVGLLLRAKGLKIATAESCTGGLIAVRLTEVPGSSQYFEAGFVTYSNMAKNRFLGVPPAMLAEHGAVSEPVARRMAEGARKAALADVAIAVTGIAGPSGGSAEKPVGTVFIALATGEGTIVRRFLFSGERKKIREKTADEALGLLLAHLQGVVS
jgi:PncC family amidohydrolase